MEEIIRQLIEQHIPITLDVGVVKKINGSICHVVSTTTDKDYFKCRINAIEQTGGDTLKVTPTEGSSVVIGVFKEHNKAIILSVSDVAKIEYKKGKTAFTIDKDGYSIIRDGVNVKDILKKGFENQNKVNNVLQKVVVSIGATPDVPKLKNIETNTEGVIADILKVFK